MFDNVNNKKIKIIAEAGVNHNGCLKRAQKMVEVAADCGVDYIKFQTFKTENLVTLTANCADYQQKNINNKVTTKSQYAMLKNLELSFSEFEKLALYCQSLGVGFLSTAFDEECLDFLLTLNMDYLKIPSGEITNYPYLKSHALTNKKIILSTGMSSLYEVDNAVNVLKKFNDKVMNNLTIMHCTTEYPAPKQELNLLSIHKLRQNFKCDIGYSDHSNELLVPAIATTLGATIIEKHFTLDKSLSGPDHKASIEPNELKKMVEHVHDVSTILGVREKEPTASEIKNRFIARKSIVAKRNIAEGELFSESNLTVKRVAISGICPMNWEKIIGLKALKSFVIDEVIEL
ncbi:N-acetylneuraminate synthase [Lentisphaerota bacterium WC36G]|nr:N-acetylneuraminate synthase [Lentisphaerae bacterium WC36]